MAIDYSKNRDYMGNYSYTALGKPVDVDPDPFITPEPGDLQERPYATITVKHTPSEFIVPYSNDKTHLYTESGSSDLSYGYINNLEDKLNKKGEDNWDDHDDAAMQTIYAMHSLLPEKKKFVKEQLQSNPHFQPQTLFDQTPSSIEIRNMVSDPRMAHTAMTLSAIAKRDLKADKIIASDDLSPWSSQLVKHAVKKGLPVETSGNNPDAVVTNDMDKGNRTIRASYQHNPWGMDRPETPIAPEEVKGAREDIREWLRGPRPTPMRNTKPVTPKGLSNQFLPGMEGFV